MILLNGVLVNFHKILIFKQETDGHIHRTALNDRQEASFLKIFYL